MKISNCIVNSLTVLSLFFSFTALSQVVCKDKSACAFEDADKFDFLIGKWHLKWNDTLSGVKTVTKELDGCAVYENYIDDPKTGNYKAISYTSFNQWTKKFSQTMIDNKGYQMISTGEWKDGKMFFVNSYKNAEGKVQMQRQIYYNIKKETMDWDFETSVDEGKSWTRTLTIHYKKIN